MIPTVSVGVVKEHLSKTESTLDFSPKSISTSLDRSGILKLKDHDRNTKKVRIGADHRALDVWVISADDLLGPMDLPLNNSSVKRFF